MRGFTLVELLVVLAIMAILSTVATTAYFGVQSKARDSARKADLYEISIALEVNKTLDSYISLQQNQFSSFDWADPKGNAYCFATGNPADPVVSSAWDSSCPAGFVPIAPGVPGSNFTQWKICAYLENLNSSGGHVFCKTSRQ